MKIEESLKSILENFDYKGELFVKGKRNTIKIFKYNAIFINVKSFKVPSFYNKIVYKFFRDSKAKRSYNNALFLQKNKIGTPNPIAYYETFSKLGLEKSFYVCEHIKDCITFRDLIFDVNYPNREEVIRKFARFCFEIHEAGIEFLDHSAGNTLIKKNNFGDHEFYLIDLNRMKFHKKMSFQLRMKNMNRTTPSNEMIQLISKEYALLYNKPEEMVYRVMWKYVEKFENRVKNKSKLKSIFTFKKR